MDISAISKYYRLISINVQPNQLLLDPTNPRIILDVNTSKKFTVNQLASEDVQDYILSVINKDVYHIAELVRSIRSSGFIDKGDDMIVKRIPGREKYLVLEGNRRTTAIKHLLSDGANLGPIVNETLRRLKVKEFIYQKNEEFSEEAVIDILLGTIHINGRLPWGALERAYYIYNSYLRELRGIARGSFEYHVECGRKVAMFFNLPVKSVKEEIIVYRIYEQLKDEGYEVLPRHFSLLDMAVRDKLLRDDYFQFNETIFQFSKIGLERFDKLCIRAKRPVNNPKDFRNFSKIFKHGTDFEVRMAEANDRSLDILVDIVDARLERKEFESQLRIIKQKLEDLQVADHRGTKVEEELILKIESLVDKKLCRLI